MGRIAIVLKIAIQMNQALWPCLAALHNAINFQAASQIARKMIMGKNHHEKFGMCEYISITVKF